MDKVVSEVDGTAIEKKKKQKTKVNEEEGFAAKKLGEEDEYSDGETGPKADSEFLVALKDLKP